MAVFAYTAKNAEGQVIHGSVTAANKDAAMKLLNSQHLTPLLIRLEDSASSWGKFKSINIGKKVKGKELVIFTRQLSTMINAGVPMVRCLATLQAQTESKVFKDQLNQIARKVESGSALADALGEHPTTFSSIYVNMVRAGEEGGILDDVLKRLALQQEKDMELRHKIKSAMTYPTVISVITIAAFFGLMGFVVPKLGKMLTDFGGELPVYTKVMLGISAAMRNYWYVGVIGLPIAVYLLRRYTKTPKGKYNYHRFLLKIPVIKVVVTKVAIARFARTFSSLMGAGVAVLDAIETTGGAIGNKVVEKELADASKIVRNGGQLSAALADSKVFPPIVSQMLAVGEETGQIDVILVKVAEFYEEEVDAFVSSLSSIIEPIMIVVLGSIVGVIAMSVFGPISQLSNNIGN